MKKHGIWVLLLVTGMLASFLLGFFAGRNIDSQPLSMSLLPTVTVPETTLADEPETTGPVYPININTADLQQLLYLPEIGPVLAQRILDYRAANGDFSSVEDLTLVEGIGAKTLDKLRQYATVGG